MKKKIVSCFLISVLLVSSGAFMFGADRYRHTLPENVAYAEDCSWSVIWSVIKIAYYEGGRAGNIVWCILSNVDDPETGSQCVKSAIQAADKKMEGDLDSVVSCIKTMWSTLVKWAEALAED